MFPFLWMTIFSNNRGSYEISDQPLTLWSVKEKARNKIYACPFDSRYLGWVNQSFQMETIIMEFEHPNPSSYFKAFSGSYIYICMDIYICVCACIYFCDAFSFRYLFSDGKLKLLFFFWCQYLRRSPFLCVTEVDSVLNRILYSWLQFSITLKIIWEICV